MDIADPGVIVAATIGGQLAIEIVGSMLSDGIKSVSSEVYRRVRGLPPGYELGPDQISEVDGKAENHLKNIAQLVSRELAGAEESPEVVELTLSWLKAEGTTDKLRSILPMMEAEADSNEARDQLRDIVVESFDGWCKNAGHARDDQRAIKARRLAARAVRIAVSALATHFDNLETEALIWKEVAGQTLALGRVEAAVGRIESAVDSVRQVLVRVTTDLGDMAARSGLEHADIKQSLGGIEDELVDVKSQLTSLIDRDGSLAEEKDKRKAAELRAEEQSLKLAELHYRKGFTAYNQARYQQALCYFEKSVAEYRTSWGLISLGAVCGLLGRPQDALAVYDEAERLRREQGKPADPDLVRNRGVIYGQLGRPEEALSVYYEAEQLRKEQGLPADPGLANNRGEAYRHLGRLEDALDAYTEAERLRSDQGLPVDPILAMNRGVVFEKIGWLNHSLMAFRKAELLIVEQGLPVPPNLVVNRGVMYVKLGRFNDSLEAFEEAERLGKEQGLPVNPALAMNRGVVYGFLGSMEKALAAFNEAERLSSEQGLPVDPDLAKSRGAIYGLFRRPKEALKAWDEAEQLRREQDLPIDPELHFNRAVAHVELGDRQTACRLAREAVELYQEIPQIPVNQAILDWIANNCEKS